MATDFDISQAAARVYAESLLELANEQGQADAVGQEMAALHQLWDKEPAVAQLMSSAAIDEEARATSIKRIFGGKVSPLVFNLLMVLNRKRRAMILRDVCIAYRHMLDRLRNRDEVFVTTAVPLEDGQRNLLKEMLRKRLKFEPILIERVNADLLGGIFVQAADRVLDTSVSRRLKDMQSALLATADRNLRAATARFVRET